MIRSAIIQHLRDVDVAHRDDGDGGYALVTSIKKWVKELDTKSRELLWNVLLEFVANQDRTLWGAAVEVLVQENPSHLGDRLTYLLENVNHGDEWRDQVCLALLRIKHQPAAANCAQHIKMSLDKGRRVVLPVLAALSHLDAEKCLSLASEYFGRVFTSGLLADKHRGYIPAFIRNFLEVDENLVSQLVGRLRFIDASSASRLASMIDECLTREIFEREIGRARIDGLRNKIRAS